MKHLISVLRKIFAEIFRVDVAVYAANAAFFLMLSLFPAMLVLLSITQYTIVSLDGIVSFFSPILPEFLLPLAEYVLRDLHTTNPVSILSLSSIALLWSASKGVYGLVKGLNCAEHLKETRPYWKVRLICLFYTAAVLVALIGTVALSGASQSLLEMIFIESSPLYRFLSGLIRYRWFVTIVFLMTVFSCIYIYFPCKKSSLRHVLPGCLTSTAGWIIFSSLLSWYIKSMGDFSSVYGSIWLIALAMLWIYACMCILFYGAMLNHYLQYHRQTLSQWAKDIRKTDSQ